MYPKTYQQASDILFDRRVQTFRIHDDLKLRFVEGGVGVFFREMKIVMFDEGGKYVRFKAGKEVGSVEEQTLDMIRLFLPEGVTVAKRGANMRMTFPDGQTRDVKAIRIGFTG